MPMDQHELQRRDAKRDIGEELLEAIRDVKAGRYGRVYATSLRTGEGTRAERNRTAISSAVRPIAPRTR